MILKIPKYFSLDDFRKCGIYFLMKKGKIIYIGQTINLIGRMMVHERRDNYDKIRLIECEPDKLNHYEKRWIIKFRPKYNRKFLYKKAGWHRGRVKFEEINLN